MRVRVSSELLESFTGLVRSEIEDDRIDLLRAALAFARIEYPDLDTELYVSRVQQLARRAAERIHHLDDPADCIAGLNCVLFQEEMFRGNTVSYYDARNSFLNDVLDRRLGIPITLALLYMEVGARAGFPLFGVGMPGHFLVKHYDVTGSSILIDAFDRGAVVTEEDCRRKIDKIYAGQVPLEPHFLLTVTRRQMLIRMLNNLRTIYLSQRDFRRGVQVVDLLLAIYPRSPEDVKQRAALRYNLGDNRGAVADFEEYIRMAPDAEDAEEVRHTALALRRLIAMMN